MQVTILDAKNCLYRFGHVHKSLTSEDGIRTGATYGIINLLRRLKKKYPDTRFVLVWDGDHTRKYGWRFKAFEGYKQRDTGEVNEDVANILGQIPVVSKVIDAIGLCQISATGVEADDIIAILAYQLRKALCDVVIYSSDKDFIQLMPKGIQLIRDVDKEHKLAPVTVKDVIADFRVAPEHVLKLRAITGDNSDRIPGAIKGVGPVKAAALLASGVDPSRDFNEQPYQVKTALTFAGKPAWDQVRLNYKLMRLPTTFLDPNFSESQQLELEVKISGFVRSLNIKQSRPNFQEMCDILSEYSLHEAIANRQEVWALAGC